MENKTANNIRHLNQRLEQLTRIFTNIDDLIQAIVADPKHTDSNHSLLIEKLSTADQLPLAVLQHLGLYATTEPLAATTTPTVDNQPKPKKQKRAKRKQTTKTTPTKAKRNPSHIAI